jgi:putative lipoic acid-binding regulatory protein
LIVSLILPLIEPAAASISIASSRSGKYLSVRVHFTAASIEQMECIYSALKAESRVLYTL